MDLTGDGKAIIFYKPLLFTENTVKVNFFPSLPWRRLLGSPILSAAKPNLEMRLNFAKINQSIRTEIAFLDRFLG